MNASPASSAINLSDDTLISARLTDYLRTQTDTAWTLGRFTRYAVGFSWITYGFTAREDGGEEQGLILRLGPQYGLFAPYSAEPQFAALKALEGSGVPLPKVYWWSDDESILGAPFFVCERVAGTAPVPWVRDSASRAPLAGIPNARTGTSGPGVETDTEVSPRTAPQTAINSDHAEPFSESWRMAIGTQFVSALAAQHRCDWRGKPGFEAYADVTVENAAEKQIAFWEAAHARWALKPYPMLRWALLWLRRNIPVAPRVSLVHGDYRLGNFLEVDGRITAILDWELVHPGDPHEDLGWAFLPQFTGGSGLVCRLVSQDDFIAQYEREVGFKVDPDALHFYRVFSLVKLALTHIAAVRCFEDGRFNDMRMPAMGTQVAPVLRQIAKLLS
ncbi:phosphotransferase family protein [Polycyclovorans algicola]|uniref:phosphotransferase family protein n=1 Tax=Polycyclovorans algicola TaxID=616992 RepID=UPI0004A6EF51|nr:phosphotransferase family protein [Polycyclovorans algicola]